MKDTAVIAIKILKSSSHYSVLINHQFLVLLEMVETLFQVNRTLLIARKAKLYRKMIDLHDSQSI